MDAMKKGLTTNEFAFDCNRRPQTLRKRFSQEGHYFGVRPIKLANGSLLWPADALEQLMGAPK